MAHEHGLQQYRLWYARLLHLYARPYRERFGGEMQQVFSDLLQERVRERKTVFGYAAWIFAETFAGIIKEHILSMTTRTTHIIGIALFTALVLLIPLIAMQFTNEVNWSAADFVIAGAILFGTGLAFELVARKAGTTAYKAAFGMGLAAGFFIIWLSGAVGIIGNEDHPANIMYAGVLAVGFFSAILSLFKAKRMAYAMLATAVAHSIVTVAALVIVIQESGYAWDGAGKTLMLNLFFVALWSGSAYLFRAASRTTSSTARAA